MNPTRADYMAGKVTHHEFYIAVARAAGISYDEHRDREKWRAMLAAGDEHLNRLHLAYWDGLAAQARANIARALKEHGDFWSLAGGVCTVKAAARQAVTDSERARIEREASDNAPDEGRTL